MTALIVASVITVVSTHSSSVSVPSISEETVSPNNPVVSTHSPHVNDERVGVEIDIPKNPVVSTLSSSINDSRTSVEIDTPKNEIVKIEPTSDRNGTHYVVILYESITLSDTAVFTGVVLVVLVYKAQPSHKEDLKDRARRSWKLRLLRTGLVKSIRNANRFFGEMKRRTDDEDSEPHSIQMFLVLFSLLPRLFELISLPLGLQSFRVSYVF